MNRQHSRNILRPAFVKVQITDLGWYDELVDRMISIMPVDGDAIDLQALFYRLQLDAATEMLFGTCANTLNPENSGLSQHFATSFDYVQDQLRFRAGLGPFVSFHWSPRFCRECEVVHRYVDDLIQKAHGHENAYTSEKHQGGPYNILRELSKLTTDAKQVRSELLNVLLAARDTTASLLSSTFYNISRHSDVLRKLREEIARLGGQKPTYEAMKEMKYLRYVLNEGAPPASSPPLAFANEPGD